MAAEYPSVLVRMSPEVVAALEQQGWEFGQPDPDGFHTPSLHLVEGVAEVGLDAAWRDAEAALPAGWALSIMAAFDGSSYLVSAMSRAGETFARTGRRTDDGLVAEGPTPAGALRDLTVQLKRVALTTVGNDSDG